MKRPTAIALAVTVAVLVLAGGLPRLQTGEGARKLTAMFVRVESAWPVRTLRFAPAPRARAGSPARAPRPLPAPTGARAPAPATPGAPGALADDPRAWVVAGALLGLGVLGLLALAAASLRRGDRERVFHLAHRGRDAAHIAGRIRVPQDAVRTLLTPGLGARRRP